MCRVPCVPDAYASAKNITNGHRNNKQHIDGAILLESAYISTNKIVGEYSFAVVIFICHPIFRESVMALWPRVSVADSKDK